MVTKLSYPVSAITIVFFMFSIRPSDLIISLRFPTVIINFNGFPNASTKACILEVNPPFDLPKPCSYLP